MNWLEDINNFIFPPYCVKCKGPIANKIEVFCLPCYELLPKTNHFDLRTNDVFMQIENNNFHLLYLATLFYFDKKSALQKALHLFKYKKKTNIGYYFGIQLGRRAVNLDLYYNADYILPLPLHPKKQKLRGYNQSAYIASGISSMLNIPVNNKAVKRVKHTSSQTKMNREERQENMKNAFCWVEEYPENTHFIIVDDIVTTGASIQSLMTACKKRYKFSVLCIGFAR